MSINLAPSWLGSSARLWILAVCLAWAPPSSSPAQVEKGEAPAASDEVQVDASDTTPSDGVVPQQTELEQRYSDPRAAAALQNTFPQLFPNALALRSNDQRAIQAMIAGQAAPNPGLLDSYARYQLSQLSRPQNIASLLDPQSAPRGVEDYEELGVNLRAPLANPENANLRTAYTQVLVGLADEVLQSQLYPRTMYMVALSRSRDPAAIPVFTRVLRDPEQPLTLKILASVGLTELAQGGAANVAPQYAREAARAVADFLEQEPDTFWPAQYRALQAIGALRQASSDPLNPQADLAATVLGFLANPETDPVVRAWAAWALGMLRPSTQNPQYNFQLIAQHIGQAALAIGAQIVEIQEENPERAVRLTDLLFQLHLGLVGASDIRDAGLLKGNHPNLNTQRAAIQGIADSVRGVLAAAVELTRVAPLQRAQYREALQAQLDALRATLDKSKPSSLTLYPEGPQFPLADAGATQPQARAEFGTTTAR